MRSTDRPDVDLNQQIATAYREACRTELEALKPGNVHRFADGHDMTLDAFIVSAEVTAIPLTDPSLSLGERIYQAVAATREVVGCNTNLGILMLCAPLIQALLDERIGSGPLCDRLQQVLLDASVEDADWLFRAIQLAAPGGLGKASQHDVSQKATAPVKEVMAHAAEHDLIARQYITGYADLFDFSLPRLEMYERRWSSREWAATGLFLSLLAHFPDSHIQRKYGLNTALEISRRATLLSVGLCRESQAEKYHQHLLQADTEFKREGINPGTSADLTVATLFISNLKPIVSVLEQTTGCSRVRDSHPRGVRVRI
ncbi:MAG: triphosphoribosyl-dephospho-CoA synthase [Candidatus Thiodiazotropha sp. (ex Lucinoma annulata)]|nr:triphosphoribosyl-dephospho-CoA synthase [Candidatus Thiodiazotropha sp. (ex Lucinoma annulata)]